jgi:hypothetical protein
VEEEGRTKDECGDERVQGDGTDKVAAEVLAVAVLFAAELEVRGYGALLTAATAG